MNSQFSGIHIWIWHHEFTCYEFIYEYDTMNSCCLNSYIWIQTISEHSLNSYIWIHITWIHSDIHIWIHVLWIHSMISWTFEFMYEFDTMKSWPFTLKQLHVKCLATSNLPMLSSSSGTTNCSKVLTLQFILPIPVMVCRWLIRSHTLTFSFLRLVPLSAQPAKTNIISNHCNEFNHQFQWWF